MKTGIVDVGGSFRAVFGSGVCDSCLDLGIEFDHAIGVSAGAANLASFIAKQRGRNAVFFKEYGFRKEFASFSSMVKTGNFMNLEYIYGTLSNSDGENPLDFETLLTSKTEFLMVATDADDGVPVYFKKSDMTKDNYAFLKASCALPVACKPFPIGDKVYYDGGLADPVPIEKAFADGCDKVVLILNRPIDILSETGMDFKAARILRKKYPRTADLLIYHHRLYDETVEKAKRYADEGKLLIISPQDSYGVSTFSRTAEGMQRLYEDGLRQGKKIEEFINAQIIMHKD